jgi:DNA-binding LacI/PurR family transcriptional regulator
LVETRRVRIADVAREAGVSKTAVSFAFNNPERLGEETVARIRDVAVTLGYRPHPVARMLKARQTATLGILTPHSFAKVFGNPYFALFFEGVSSVIDDRGFGLLFIAPLGGSLERALDRATVDGVLVVGIENDHPEVDGIRRAGVPMVSVDAPTWPEHGAVEVADQAGARAAGRHLVELGHGDVLLMSIGPHTVGPSVSPGQVVRRRLRGYREGLASIPGAGRTEWVIDADATVESGQKEFRAAWDRGVRPTAVLAMSDAMAVGVMQAAMDLGLSIPGDLSIVGFDDLPMSELCNPPLTTVHQPVRAKGEAAARLLLEALDKGRSERGTHRLLDTALVIRGSTAPPRRSNRSVGAVAE